MDGFETLDPLAEEQRPPTHPGPKTLTMALGFLLPALLGLLAACLAALGPDRGAGAPAAPRGESGLERPEPVLAGAWHPCGPWHARPGFDLGCLPA